MPSMVSTILRASREAARAGRSAASAASRCAAVLARSRSGSGGAAASGPLRRGSYVAAACAPIPRKRLSLRSDRSPGPVTAPPPSGSTSSPTNGYGYGGGSTVVTPPPFDMAKAPPFLANGRPKFEADEKDLESDEALFALYERWCKVFNQERRRDEMARRFGKFKKSVLLVEQNKKGGQSDTLELNKFADGKEFELCSCKAFSSNFIGFAKRMPTNMMIYARPPDFTCSRRRPWDTISEIPNQSA